MITLTTRHATYCSRTPRLTGRPKACSRVTAQQVMSDTAVTTNQAAQMGKDRKPSAIRATTKVATNLGAAEARATAAISSRPVSNKLSSIMVPCAREPSQAAINA